MTEIVSTFCDFCNKQQQKKARGYLEFADHESAQKEFDWVEVNDFCEIMCTECQNDLEP